MHVLETRAKAPGKVNLYLAVGNPREDGYHPLATLFSSVNIYETVTARDGQKPGITLSLDIVPESLVDQQHRAGEFDLAEVPLDESNLAYRAAVSMVQAHGLTVNDLNLHLHIDKAVPVAGGMAGGSADAAAALLAVDQYLYEKQLTERTLGLEELLALAAPLGADVPFVVRAAFPLGGLAVGEGTGTELRIVELPEDMIPLDIVLVAASEGLSTPQVFSELDEGRAAGRYPEAGELQVPSGLLHALTQTEAPIARIHEIGRQLRNDLQGPAVTLAPDLETILTMDNESMVEAFVSGSGPTVAILAEDATAADELAAALRRRGRHAIATQTPAML